MPLLKDKTSVFTWTNQLVCGKYSRFLPAHPIYGINSYISTHHVQQNLKYYIFYMAWLIGAAIISCVARCGAWRPRCHWVRLPDERITEECHGGRGVPSAGYLLVPQCGARERLVNEDCDAYGRRQMSGCTATTTIYSVQCHNDVMHILTTPHTSPIVLLCAFICIYVPCIRVVFGAVID